MIELTSFNGCEGQETIIFCHIKVAEGIYQVNIA